MKCYRKEDLKRIGYYRTEADLQERLKKLDWYCALECVFKRVSPQTEKCFMVCKGGREFVLSIQGFVHENEFLKVMNCDKFERDYVSEDEVSTYLSEQGYKVEKLFHVTKENIKFISNFDGIIERVILPEWIETKVKEVGIRICRKEYEFKRNLFENSTFAQNKIILTFEECIGGCCSFIHYKVNFGEYIALLDDGSLKVFSEELVGKFHLEK